MSKDALAGVYAYMLTHDLYRETVAHNPEALHDWDLTDEEKKVLMSEARTKNPDRAIGSGPVLEHLSTRRGPPLSPTVASSLGIAMNQAAGLPLGALNGPGFLANAGCCPWGKPFIGRGGINEKVK
jgi:hypothetical protein